MDIVMVCKLFLVLYIQVLHYLPAKERKDVITSSTKQLTGARHVPEESTYLLYLLSHIWALSFIVWIYL